MTDEYRPSDREPFMRESQREYFRAKLLSWRADLLNESKETLQRLHAEDRHHADYADAATSVIDREVELRAGANESY